MAELEGYEALRRRLAAISDTKMLMGQLALLGVREAQHIAAGFKKTGNLMGSIRPENVTATSAQIIAGGRNGVGYARYVEFGTGIYGPRKRRIVPVTAKVLAWRVDKPGQSGQVRLSGSSRTRGGQALAGWAFARSVRGRPATPYLMPGAKSAIEKGGLGYLITAAWNGAA